MFEPKEYKNVKESVKVLSGQDEKELQQKLAEFSKNRFIKNVLRKNNRFWFVFYYDE